MAWYFSIFNYCQLVCLFQNFVVLYGINCCKRLRWRFNYTFIFLLNDKMKLSGENAIPFGLEYEKYLE